MNQKNNWNKYYSAVFLLFVFALLTSQLLVPGISISAISEKYLFRETLIRSYRNIKYRLGDRVYANAVIGKDGWMFITSNLSLRNYQKSTPLSVSNIKQLVKAFERIDAAVQTYGGTFLIVVAPDKSTVYPKYMPDEIEVIGETSSLDRLVERVHENSSLQLLDLRPTMLEAGRISQVYYKTDTHWNCIGAYSAYEAILARLAETTPGIISYSLEDFSVTELPEDELDIAKMIEADVRESMMTASPKFDSSVMQLPNPYPEYENMQVVANSNTELPYMFMIHDSFYPACLNSFIKPGFGKIISVPYRDVEVSDLVNMITFEQPDVVILEFAERLMEDLIWHFSE